MKNRFPYLRGSFVLAVLWALILSMATSCRNERFEVSAPEIRRDDIAFEVKAVKTLTTKAASPYMELVYTKDSVNVYLEVAERDMPNTLVTQNKEQTKGAPCVDDNIGRFTVTSFLSTDFTTPFFSDLDLTYEGSAVGTGYYWPLTTPATKITFFGHSRTQENGTLADLTYNAEDAEGSFSYELPNPVGDQTSAVEQPDLMFAIAADRVNTGSPVDMMFYHALTAIVFEVGSIPADFIVNSVEFTKLPSAGACEYYLEADGSLAFDWDGSSPKTFTQEFNKPMSDEDGLVADEEVSSVEQTFMMIPGTLPADAELIISVSFDKKDKQNTSYTIRKPLKDLLSEWKAGKQYIYRISSPEEIEVQVDDEVVENGTKKQDIEIKNTGLATTYVRALLVGYWVIPGATEEDDVVVGQWRQPRIDQVDASADGVYEQAADFAQNWIVGDDGYYYYKHPVPSGEFTSDLFESYILTGNPPVVDAELVLTIAAQSVVSTKIGETPWPVKLDADNQTLIKK